MGLMDYLVPLARIATALESIAASSKRLADVAEGKLPDPVVVPEAEPEPARMAPAATDADYKRIEDIEARYLALSGRLPTADEICRELDGLEIPPEVSELAMQHHLRTRGGQV